MQHCTGGETQTLGVDLIHLDHAQKNIQHDFPAVIPLWRLPISALAAI